jgi:large conductance mechanosensitive channel
VLQQIHQGPGQQVRSAPFRVPGARCGVPGRTTVVWGGATMLKGFKDFILRGNVIDLAVAVVIGAAFTALIAAITANLIQPVLNALGGVDAGGWGFYVNPSNPDTFINIGAIVTAIITFLITAAVVYFVFVAPMKKILAIAEARKAATKTPIKADPTEVELLVEIRDLLQAGNAHGATTTVVTAKPTNPA